MKICVDCSREMKCEKNGVGADFGNGHVYAGDKWKCPHCEREILICNHAPSHDPSYTMFDEYMKVSTR